MSDLKFDKRDLDMVLECLNDLSMRRAKRQWQILTLRARLELLLIFMELCSCISNGANAILSSIWTRIPIKRITSAARNAREFYCEVCGWTGEKAPFEEVKEGGNQAE